MISKSSIFRNASVVFAFVACTGLAQAAIVTATNAGSTLATAQVITQGTGTLTDIVGMIDDDTSQVELFEIYLTTGASFSATTVSNTSNFFDSELFLLNSAGIGVYENNDDLNSGGTQSTLPTGNTFSPTTSGYYFLGLTSNEIDPLSAVGTIFNINANPSYLVLGPNGPGGATPLTGYQGTSTEIGTSPFDIKLTGVSIATATSTPEPAYTVVLFLGLAILLLWKRKAALISILGTLIGATGFLGAQEMPKNLAGGLEELVKAHAADPAGFPTLTRDLATGKYSTDPKKSRLMVDSSKRVLVQVFLDGRVLSDAMEQKVAQLGGQVVAVDKEWRKGVVDAYIPVAAAVRLATEPGVRSITLSRKPQVHPVSGVPPYSGAVTPGTQSGSGMGPGNTPMTNLEHTDVANQAGYNGAGITVAVTSDSYNATGCGTKAVAAGYLPSSGVTVINDQAGSDEGCAMLQLVYDVAPQAKLCFAGAQGSASAFSNNIRSMRTNPNCLADIIADDIGFGDEPFFSDGQIASAVQAVVNTPANGALAGKPVSYFVYGGNDGNNAYQTTFSQISNAAARSLSPTLLSQINASYTGGGFQNFGTAANPSVALPVTIPADTPYGASNGSLNLFWDDPFNDGAVTTDYNIFIVNASGAILASGTSNNISSDQPLEILNYANTASNSSYFVVVSRTTQGTQLANRLLLVENDNGAGFIFFPLGITGPTVFGHSSAASANAVASVNFGQQASAPFYPFLNSYNSRGPVTIAFDANNNRLAVAQVRKKPDMAAITENTVVYFEGANTVQFSGTSAAAPAAAGIAALLLQKAGGPQSLTPAQVHSYMVASGPSRDVDLFSATAATSGLTVTSSDAVPTFFAVVPTPAPFDTTFNVSFNTSGQTLSSLKIDLSGISGASFEPGSYPFHLDSATPGITVSSSALTNNNTTLTVNFTGFAAGDQVSFDLGATAPYPSPLTVITGGFSDLITGVPVTATLSGGGTLTASFANVIGKAWTQYDGFGIVNATTALSKIQ